MKGIRVRTLRVVGVTKNYEVSFVRDDQPRALSVVAGQISTGKSSVLEFIDYCLGASDHPQHQEIHRKALAVMLEIGAGDSTYVIERRLFTNERVAWVHHCSLAQIGQPHSKSRKPLEPAGDSSSLSTFLLDQCGLAGLSLREAPSKESSSADPLSFRDVMWLSFLPNRRLDNQQLLHEGNFMQMIKLRQVIEILFGVHDNQAAELADQVQNLEARRRAVDADILAIELFLDEHGVPARAVLDTRAEDTALKEAAAIAQLRDLDERMLARTGFAEEMRQHYVQSSALSRRWATIMRDRETLLNRLLPLRGQYAEDERKLVFYDEAHQLFDPLRVTKCPACLQSLPTSASITDGVCSLCGQAVMSDNQDIDVEAELRAVRSRRRAIDRYIQEVEQALGEAQTAHSQALAAEAEAQRQLDALVADSVAPYVSDRDALVRQHESIRAEIMTVRQQLDWRDGLDRRLLERAQLDQEIENAKTTLRELQSKQLSRDMVLSDLSDRFRLILQDFGFPKLYDPGSPYLDRRFVPHVRGVAYSKIGSSGGLTLTALAWMLSVFELATERGHPHPGFLMIDSPQKNLSPEEGAPGDEFRDPAIVERVWKHIQEWTSGRGKDHQIIVVDNAPPRAVESAIVIRYSGRPDVPPYGLIDDETS